MKHLLNMLIVVCIGLLAFLISLLWPLITCLVKFGLYETNLASSSMKELDDKYVSLMIGIISKRENFRQRQSLRNTWLTILPNSFRYKFVVGKTWCNVHPIDRKSIYSCENLDVVIPERTTEDSIFFATSKTFQNGCNSDTRNHIGFGFNVNIPIVVQSLGIKMKSPILNESETKRVLLIDGKTSAKLAYIDFDLIDSDRSDKDYVYKEMKDPIYLPKDFIGFVKVEDVDGNELIERCSDETSEEGTHKNIVTVLNIIVSGRTSHNKSCRMPSFSFTIKDTSKLNSHKKEIIYRQTEWKQHNEEIETQLRSEEREYKDLLFVDLIDVYRNLPGKVLYFFEWVHNNYDVEFVLKTDDDTFIDIVRVKRELDNSTGWGWWSCFRMDWPVQKVGKWRETAEYQKDVYPPFPSGAGYVLPRDVLDWLIERSKALITDYQGEDVALGIWLESLNMSRHVGNHCYWACDKRCHERTCNAIQLAVNEMYSVWKHYQVCDNRICHCPG